jgi:hypothetical protein
LLCAQSTRRSAFKSSADVEACVDVRLNRPCPKSIPGLVSAKLVLPACPTCYGHIRDVFSRCSLNRAGAGAVMRDQRRNPRNFGVGDKPRCPNCGAPMSLTRRSPAADYALQYERQKFTCPECDHEIERVVDADGKQMQFANTQPAHH